MSSLATRTAPDAELERRRDGCMLCPRKDQRGYRQLYEDHVLLANECCDLDFLRGRAPVISESVTHL